MDGVCRVLHASNDICIEILHGESRSFQLQEECVLLIRSPHGGHTGKK